MLFEGGIRVPFLVCWPRVLEGGAVYDEPVSSLDIFPTILAAAGIEHPGKEKLDGINLLPFLKAGQVGPPHQDLFWRYSDGAGYAVRHKDFKLVRSAYKDTVLLFDLVRDPYEHNDLSAGNPEMVKKLQELYDVWTKETVTSKWQDPHLENVIKEEKKRQDFIDRAKAGEKR